MPDVYIKTDGISYLSKCLTSFTKDSGFLLLYFAAVLFILIKGTDKEKKIFVPAAVVSILTVYNPIFPLLLSLFTDISSEYYRFFWMSPVVILLGYVLTKLILYVIDGKIKNRAAVIILTCLIFFVSSESVFKSGMKLPENAYKMPDEMIEISEIIHNDSDAEYPKAFLEFEYNMQMRQYDPKMLLTIDREDYLYAVSKPYTQEMIDSDEFPQYRLLAALVRYQDVDTDKLIDALELTATEYVVLTKASTMVPKLKDYGLTTVKETENNIILKYKRKDDTRFELVDYSECYENGW